MTGGLRARLASGEPLLGTFSLIPSLDVIELIAVAGLGFVIVDMEHGPYDLGSARAAAVAARARGLPALVRVPVPEPALIGLVLDQGFDGALVPHVSSAESAAAIVRAARFVPDGDRGAHPYVRAADYGARTDFFSRANDEAAVMVMVEGPEGIGAVPEIAGVPGLDALFLGPVDLSHALGVPGQTDHPLVVAELEEVARYAASRGVATAIFAPGPAAARAWWDRGVRVVACGVDTALIRAAFERVVTESSRRPCPG